MSYFALLGLEREPFSTSPDPDFFYRSLSHITALRRLELNIRLRRGVSLICGDVGTGKTVLCRVLAQEFARDGRVDLHMLLDPDFDSKAEFLATLCRVFRVKSRGPSALAHKEALERHLFRQGASRGRISVCIIDEGQKLSTDNLELLRTLLNYETSDYKLLQLVIMGQPEMVPKMEAMRNFLDRVSLKYTINPLGEKECGELIMFRLRQAGYSGRKHLFDDAALRSIYLNTQGVPRRIAMLCHEALKKSIMHGKLIADAESVERAAREIQFS